MNVLILAAGNGQRFALAGYPQSKPLLPMPDGRPLLSWLRERLPDGQCIAVIRSQDDSDLAPWLDGARVVRLDHPTPGPLASACAGAPRLKSSDELLITYCDTFLLGGADAFIDAARRAQAETGMVLFESSDPRYGYWDGACVIEKQVISSWAVSGLFYFRRAITFLARAHQASRLQGAGIPSLLDRRSFPYYAPADQVIDIGTPADYEAFLSRWHRRVEGREAVVR